MVLPLACNRSVTVVKYFVLYDCDIWCKIVGSEGGLWKRIELILMDNQTNCRVKWMLNSLSSMSYSNRTTQCYFKAHLVITTTDLLFHLICRYFPQFGICLRATWIGLPNPLHSLEAPMSKIRLKPQKRLSAAQR